MAPLSFTNVEAAVNHAHVLLRERRHEFRRHGLHDPVDWLDPHMLAEMLGLKYELEPSIRVADRLTRDNPYGLLILNERRCIVSEERGPAVARYTGAHEIGHYLHHQSKLNQHWERSFDSEKPRPLLEREADLFASIFLMPPKLLLQRIEYHFAQRPLRVNDNLQFLLCPNYTDLDPAKLDLEYALARASIDFRRRHIVPLHQQFKVSVKAMAIRLQQLRVFSYPTTSYRTDL